MTGVIQRVLWSTLAVNEKEFSSIQNGILLLLGVEKNDSDTDMYYVADKVVNLRIFEDENKKMNLSLLDKGFELMVVSQFTLAGDTKKGRRPSFSNAMSPAQADKIYKKFVEYIKQKFKINVKTGVFGGEMKISLINDGPVTFIIDSKK
ncbi:MAG: D-aminoacyl-tRNA deacylase [Candidatus Muiribacteriota bacterium]